MTEPVYGIHHVTAISSNAQRNVNFYVGVLGLRMVKRTVNFDDPSSYHFYYGDEQGTPGTILTFFIWPGGSQGQQGTGQFNSLAFGIPQTSLGYWIARLVKLNIPYEGPGMRFGEQALTIRDPDGLAVHLVAQTANDSRTGWNSDDIPTEHAIRGIHSVALWTANLAATNTLLLDIMNFEPVSSEDGSTRCRIGDGSSGTLLDLHNADGFWRGNVGSGSIHHVAWRAHDDAHQLALAQHLHDAGVATSPVMDRSYFHSIYFREPGGALFEIATDSPGFGIDEPLETLGTHLKLPSWYESRRSEIEQLLPPFSLPQRLYQEDQP